MHSEPRPLPADGHERERAELARAVASVRPTLLLVCNLKDARSVAPNLRGDLATILDRLQSFLGASAQPAAEGGSPFVADPAVVHIWVHGKALCETVSGPTWTWPIGHTWVARGREHTIPTSVRCQGCYAAPKTPPKTP